MRRRWPTPTPGARVALLVAAGVLLTGAALWAGSVGPWIGRPDGSATGQLPTFDLTTLTPPTPKNVEPPAAPPSAGTFDPTVLLLILGGVLLAAVVVLAASMIRNHTAGSRPRKPPTVRDEKVEPAPVLPDPARPFDPRQAADYVIACWDQLERLAAGRGAGRRPEQTPTEFIEALRLSYRLDERAAAELLSLYQRARFDHVRLLPNTAMRARTCVDALLMALEGVQAPS